MFDEVLCHLFTLSIHGVLSVLDLCVPPLHLNTSGGPSIPRCYKVGANEANTLVPVRSEKGTTCSLHLHLSRNYCA